LNYIIDRWIFASIFIGPWGIGSSAWVRQSENPAGHPPYSTGWSNKKSRRTVANTWHIPVSLACRWTNFKSSCSCRFNTSSLKIIRNDSLLNHSAATAYCRQLHFLRKLKNQPFVKKSALLERLRPTLSAEPCWKSWNSGLDNAWRRTTTGVWQTFPCLRHALPPF
jgi:hypothetical protein